MLETERLILRDFTPDDFERVHLYAALPDFTKYEVWGPNQEEDTRRYLRECAEKAKAEPRYSFELAVCLKDSGLLIGGCGLRREGALSRVGHFGYAINPDYQRNGYATEAAQALIRFGFSELGLVVLFAVCDTRNVASYRVMEKLGLKRVGHFEKDRLIRGERHDSYRYEVYADADLENS